MCQGLNSGSSIYLVTELLLHLQHGGCFMCLEARDPNLCFPSKTTWHTLRPGEHILFGASFASSSPNIVSIAMSGILGNWKAQTPEAASTLYAAVATATNRPVEPCKVRSVSFNSHIDLLCNVVNRLWDKAQPSSFYLLNCCAIYPLSMFRIHMNVQATAKHDYVMKPWWKSLCLT